MVKQVFVKINYDERDKAVVLPLLIRIREIRGSILCQGTDCPRRGISWFTSVPPRTC
jgi:hypothetical protein